MSKNSLPCKEFSEFKDALQQERAIDDRIIYKLNTSVPTESFSDQVNAKEQCMTLYSELMTVHDNRRAAIQSCVEETKATIGDLSSHSDSALRKQLRKEQTKLRLMQNELVVEDVIHERSMKVFRERCWKSFRPPES